MTLNDFTPFEALLKERGYKRETNRLALGHAEQQWWKGFWTKGKEYRNYTVCFRVYEHMNYPGYDVDRFGRWGVEYRMSVNHQTDVDVELAKLDVLHDSMTVEEWERRCAVLWDGMSTAFARQPETKGNAHG
jgi:hypothetical protein